MAPAGRRASTAGARRLEPSALPLARQAVAEARAAGDEPLLEWASRVSGRIAILAGHGNEGERALAALLESSEAAPDIAYEMAQALHLAGETARSARWYGWGLSRVRDQQSGRFPYEFLQGQLFALVEAGRWRDADEAITRYESAFPGQPHAAIFKAFLAWRRGGRPERLPDEARHGDDLCRYWSLEARLAAGDSLDDLSRDLLSERAVASDTGPLLTSLTSEIEARRGNLDAALAHATTAWSEVRAACLRQPWARAHLPIVADRLAKLAKRSNRPDLVRGARRSDGDEAQRRIGSSR